MIDHKIEVSGVKELNRALKQVDAELPKELKRKFMEVADHVVGVAQQRMPFRTGEAAASLRPRSTQKGAGIAFPKGEGVYKGAYYPWLDFGGSTGRGHSVGQAGSGSINRPVVKGGRFLYPAIVESEEYIEKAVLDAVESVADAASLENKGGI